VSGARTWIAVLPALALLAAGPVPANGAGPTPAQAAQPAATQEKAAAQEKAPAQPVRPKRQPKRLHPSQFVAATKMHLLAGSKRNHIVLRPDRLELMTGERVVWQHRVPGARGVGLPRLYRLVHAGPKPKWLTQLRTGVFVLRAALVQAPGTRLTIAAPRVRELRMMSTGRVDQEVYLAGVSARVSLSGVLIRSWRLTGGPDPTPSVRRPFVSYDQPGSALHATRTTFADLGGDNILGYGVTWGRGVTGSAVGCTFQRNFFGAYTNAAVGVVFRRNTFRDNDLYGLDPHTNSTHLTVDRNVAFGNGSHGIIFSQDVVDSSVTNNRSFGNRRNGIMMDERSDRNVLRGNQVWSNDGDGIVVQNSARVVVRSNTVTGNRVGVRVNGASPDAVVDGNRLVGNGRGVEFYAGPAAAAATVIGNDVDGHGQGYGISVKQFGGVRIAGNRVSRYSGGVLLSAGAARAVVTGNRLADTRRGIEVAAGAPHTRLGRNVVDHATDRGLVLAGAGTSSDADTVTGADIGVDLRADAVVSGVQVRHGRRGVNVVAGHATLTAATIDVREHGVDVAPAATVSLTGSTVIANQPVVGAFVQPQAGNTTGNPPPPVPWLAIAGMVFVLLAVAMHVVSRRRSPACHPRGAQAPSGVRNAW
jgi:parallel beta-helix repeat protein